MNNNLSKETKVYLDLFYQPKFTEFDFICLFISQLKLKNIYSFDVDELEKQIMINKLNPLFEELLKEFKFKSNGIHKYSSQLREVIRMAKYSELIFSISPEVDSIVHIKDIDIKALTQGKEEYYDLMNDFINYLYDLKHENLISNYVYVDAPRNTDYVNNKTMKF